MPYIVEDDRIEMELEISNLSEKITNPGEFNYAVSMLMQHYIDDHGKSYSVLNEIIGILECAKLEMYRRVAAPYEDQKIEENGDVYRD